MNDLTNEHTNTLYFDMQRSGLLQRPAYTPKQRKRRARAFWGWVLLAVALLAFLSCRRPPQTAGEREPHQPRVVAGPLFI